MPPTTLHEAPAPDSFTPLAEHQSQTPSSFFGAKPVLHFHAKSIRARIPRSLCASLPIFGGTEALSASGEGDDEIVLAVVEAFVSSESLVLFNTAKSVGVSIPYPSISLHAIQRLKDPEDSSADIQGLYMQLELSDPYQVGGDEDMDAVEVTLIPPPSDGAASSVQNLFEAVSNCSNLHPDPTFEDDEEMCEDGVDSRIVFEGNVGYEGVSGLPGVQLGSADGGLPPPFPGSGGWITADNVSEYFDADGNWIGGGTEEVLGEGAGRIRTRDEVDGEIADQNGEQPDEHKRPRTD